MSLKDKSIKIIEETISIIVISSFLGLIVNTFHPKGIKITSKRPSLKFAADTVLAQDLPSLSISIRPNSAIGSKEKTVEPLLITTAQVLQLKTNDQALIVDARSKEEFLKEHIPGAENLPCKDLSNYKTKLDSLPKDKWLICYCDGPSCDQAELLAYELIVAGYELVAVYTDGLHGWKKSGQEIEAKEVKTHAR